MPAANQKEGENIADKVNQEAKAQESGLEKKVNKGFFRKTFRLGWNLGMAGATTALSMSYLGPAGAIIGGAFGLGRTLGNIIKGTSLYDTIDDALSTYSSVNAVLYPMVCLGSATYPLIPNKTMLGKVARTIYGATLYNAVFTASFKAAKHLVSKYLNPIGLIKSIKHNFYHDWKRFAIGFSPAYALTANGISQISNIPTFAYNALPLGFYNAVSPPGPKKRYERKEISPKTAAQPAAATS